MLPLTADAIQRIDADASPAERFWLRIPIAGWMIAGAIWSKRTRPIVEDVHRQLLARRPCPQMWGDNPQRAESARWLCAKIAECIDWPSDCFIPNDPISVLLWEHVYSAPDTSELMLWIEERFSIRLSFNDVETWFGQTLGELVDLLLSGRTAFSKDAPQNS